MHIARSASATLAIVLLLAICPIAQAQWEHSSLSGAQAQSQFAIDRGACIGTAYRTVGQPPSSPARSPSTTTTFSGTTSNGGTFQGQATTGPGPELSALPAFEAAEAQERYNGALQQVFRGCMVEKGWNRRQ